MSAVPSASARVSFVRCLSKEGFHRVHLREYETKVSPPLDTVVCVHGLTRNCRDFDFVAEALSTRGFRVVCVDVVGRGRSDRLKNPALYGYPQYLSDMAAVLARVDPHDEGVLWLGTSMGGLIGMMLAAQPNSPVRALILNDVGACVRKEALQRIAKYIVPTDVFADHAAAVAHFKQRYAPFGPTMTDEHWDHLARHGVAKTDDGTKFVHAYDPHIADVFSKPEAVSMDVDLWPVFNKITCPILVLHGVLSDVLDAQTAAKMAERENVTVVDFPETGHVPPLFTEDGGISHVCEFFDAHNKTKN